MSPFEAKRPCTGNNGLSHRAVNCNLHIWGGAIKLQNEWQCQVGDWMCNLQIDDSKIDNSNSDN